LKVEIFPCAEADIIRQFRYYLVDQDAPLIALRFREAVIESLEQLKRRPRVLRILHGKRDVRRILRRES
jgi:plasmid stabilization system protein ParE